MDDGDIDEQSFVRDWVRRRLAPGPLDAEARREITTAIGRCYEAAGLPRPEHMVWVPSPVVAGAAATTLARVANPGKSAKGRQRLWRVVSAIAAIAVFGAAGTIVAVVVESVLPIVPSFFGAVAGVGIAAAHLFVNQWSVWSREDEQEAGTTADHNAGAEIDRFAERLRDACLTGTKTETLDALKDILDEIRHIPWLSDVGDGRRVRNRVIRSLAGDLPPGVAPAETSYARMRGPDAGAAGLEWLAASGQITLDARAQAWVTASRVIWFAHPGFVIIAQPPTEIHIEELPGGGYRLHRRTGPALAWRTGPEAYVWHGIKVPADMLTGDGWSVQQIHAGLNSEHQRIAIERMGWMRYIQDAGLQLIATAPDPGNPPHRLALYDDQWRRLGDARMLVMINGSPDRAGGQMMYAEPVPARFTDPVEAAAWQYDVPVELYRRLGRRT